MWYIFLGAFLCFLIYYKLVKPTKFWKKRGVIHEPALPIFGNFLKASLRQKHSFFITLDLYRKYQNERYVGILQFTHPMLMIRDLDLIKKITIKDFDSFHDHFPFASFKKDPLFGKNLAMLAGNEWRQMRATLSPAFTTNKLKNMHQLMTECAKNFVGHFKGKENIAVEMKEIFTRFTTDVIASTAFGIQIDSLNEPKNEFFVTAKALSKFGVVQIIRMLVIAFLGRFVNISFFPKNVINFFRSTIKDNIAERERKGIVRPDMIHLMMEARKGKLKYETNHSEESFAAVEESQIGQNQNLMKISDDDITAQAMTFFFAGFETVSTASSFLAYELAVHFDIQKKLQEEIDCVNQKFGGDISYETLMTMKYLDQVVCESLRLWPPGFQTERMCTKSYKIEPKGPNEKAVLLEEGTSVVIPVVAIHRDSQYYPDPDRFDPERFSDENKHKIVPGSYMPFGAGPRNCIASRFALLEIKTLFFYLLSKFDIVPIDSTEIPLKISPKKVNLQPEKGFRLGIKPRKTSFC